MKKIITPFIVFMLCLLPACSGDSSQTGSANPNSPAYENITAIVAYEMMQKLDNFILLDVRSSAEFRDLRIPGAILIPVNELEGRAEAELPDKNEVIFVYCRAGVRATNAARILVEKRYTQVFNMGGILDWPYETASGD